MNRNNIKLLALLIAFSCGVTYASKKNLSEIAHSIVKAAHRSGRKKAREELLNTLKKTHATDASTLSYAFAAFHHQKNSHLFDNYAGIIEKAIKRFTQTPGFIPKMHTLLAYADNPSFTKGHVYELEAAIIREKHGDRVMQFCYDFYCNKTNCMRSIDLVTNQHFIECKNIDWSLYTSSDKAEKIRNQLLSYNAFTQSSDDDRTLLLVSKQPITDAWKEWLEDNDIAYKETH